MRGIGDLITTLSRPGTMIRHVGCVVQGVEVPLASHEIETRRVIEVSPDAILLDNGSFMPIGCAGVYQFNGAPDRFSVRIGVAELYYEIAQGTA